MRPRMRTHAEVRELVVGHADGPAPERVEHVVERVGVDGRREAVADRGSADRDLGCLAPGVDRQVVGQFRGVEDGRVGAGRVAGGRRGRDPGPAQLGGLWQPGEGLGLAFEADDADRLREEGEERVEEGRLADLAGLGGDDDRDAGLDEEPQRGGQFGVEGALADQRDDRAIGGVVGHCPSLRCDPKRVKPGQ